METILAVNKPHTDIKRKMLLACGIFSSLYYIAINIFVPFQFPGYSFAYHTVSELSAIDAPTRNLWVALASAYSMLIAVFGLGIRKSAGQSRSLRIAGTLLIIYAIIGLFWPPMHQREVLAAGGGTITDTLHLTFTVAAVILMLLIMAYSAASFGSTFRLYSIITAVILLAFGALTGLEAPLVQSNQPTPYIGIWERISIGIYMIWTIALSYTLLNDNKSKTANRKAIV